MDLRRIFVPEARTPSFWILNLLHTGGFFLAVGPYPAGNLPGLAAFAIAAAGQILLWRKLLEAWTGNLAGFTFAMWLIKVSGYDAGPNRPNVALAIVLVAGELILALLLDARGKRRGEPPLTQSPGDS